MRHKRGIKKLNKATDQRMALIKSGVQSLFEQGQIITTWRRAKEIQKAADRLVTLAKDGRLPARRVAYGLLWKKEVVKDIFQEIPTRFAERKGGYTRVLHLGPRRGDSAPMAVIQLV